MATRLLRQILLTCGSLWLLVMLAGCEERAGSATTFAIATGGPAGLYYPFGGAMASVWSKHLPHCEPIGV